MRKIFFILLFILPCLSSKTYGESSFSLYETYLNSIHKMEAEILQKNADGSSYSGYLWLERPDRLRIEYEPAYPLTLVAREGSLYTYDHGTKEWGLCNVQDTPASFFLRPHIHFSGDVMAQKIEKEAGVIRLTLVQKEDPEGGALVFVFQESPLTLRQWVVKESTGQETQVTLLNARVNGKKEFSPLLFDPQKTSQRMMLLNH